MTATSVSDEELRDVLATTGELIGLHRRPHAYATTWPLEEVTAELGDGETMTLVLKEIDWSKLSAQAKEAKSQRLHDPGRELETYRRLLAPAGVGPAFHGGRESPEAGRAWLLIDLVDGVALWQVGEVHRWVSVARWLAGFHAQFTGIDPDAAPGLVRYDQAALERSALDVVEALRVSTDPRAADLAARLWIYEAAVASITDTAPTLVHGEFYASNVLVGADGTSVWPIDWEMAGVGPGAIDLAALCAGWDPVTREAIKGGYAEAATVALGQLRNEVAVCTVHLSLQWLARSPRWQPPAAHATDWLAEALDALVILEP